MFPAIVRTLVFLNSKHGRGEVYGAEMNEDYKGGWVVLFIPGLGKERVRFRFNGRTNTVTFEKHQRRIIGI